MNREVRYLLSGVAILAAVTGCRTPDRYASQGNIIDSPQVGHPFRVVTKAATGENLPSNVYELLIVDPNTGEPISPGLEVLDQNGDGACAVDNLIIRPNKQIPNTLDITIINRTCDDVPFRNNLTDPAKYPAL